MVICVVCLFIDFVLCNPIMLPSKLVSRITKSTISSLVFKH